MLRNLKLDEGIELTAEISSSLKKGTYAKFKPLKPIGDVGNIKLLFVFLTITN